MAKWAPILNINQSQMKNTVVYSKYGIQKAATLVAAYLLKRCNLNYQSVIKIMQTKAPLLFKNPCKDEHILLYKNALLLFEKNPLYFDN